MSILKNHKILLVIIGVLLLSNIWLLYTQVWNKKPRTVKFGDKELRERVKMKLEKEVGFTSQQLAQYDSLRTKHFDAINPMFEELKMAKDSFFNLVFKPGVPDSVIVSYANKIGEKQQAIDMRTFNHFTSIRSICTAEQHPKIDSFIYQVVKRIIGNGRHMEKNKNK